METEDSTKPRTAVRIGESVIADEGTLMIHGLGSCLAVGLYDSEANRGGLGHILLPEAPDRSAGSEPGRYADTGVALLYRKLTAAGTTPSAVVANLAGGSNMFETESPHSDLGRRNVLAAKAALRTREIPVVSLDTGGTAGRTVRFEVSTGRFTVTRHGEAR